MLIIKNLCKTYRSRGGVEVKALDNVSVSFPETGMVFLLGKSGSGKSTLLNVCGGLDTPDSGEIIIRGRSSKTFSGSDFDSYRNTFVGFIFQEYNILNEFTVEENLSLALELQGKNKNKERVDELLEQVDLKGFARRKPNTLSGGQKQRIAIARALIKDPKIIMADEPTGALDSNTGKQVLDTLKKLSESRLVIIVSHDREFAEIYGDRVIELKDGKIISDVTKEKVAATEMGENVSVIAGNTLSIKKGSQLTKADIAKIQDFILKTDGNVLIANSEKDIASFKQANRIDADGAAERFAATQTDKISLRQYTKEEGELVRSKLPMRKAVRIGASSLKVKPIRLLFTILLSVAAFVLFGVFSTMMTYNQNEVLSQSYTGSDYDAIALGKKYYQTETQYNNGEASYEWKNEVETFFTPADLENLRTKFGNDVLGVYCFNPNGETAKPENVRASANTSTTLSSAAIKGFAVAPEDSAYRTDTKLLAGTYPVNDDEVAVSSWYYTMIKGQALYGVITDSKGYVTVNNTAVEINAPTDLIGQSLYIPMAINTNGYYRTYLMLLKITGVFDGGEIPAVYQGWDNDANSVNEWDNEKLMKYNQYIDETMQRIFLVGDGFFDSFVEETGWKNTSLSNSDYEKYFSQSKYYYFSDQASIWLNISATRVYDGGADQLPVVWFEDGKTSLGKNEIILSLADISSLIYSVNMEEVNARWQEKYEGRYTEEYENYQALANENYNLWQASITETMPNGDKTYEALFIQYNELASFYNNIMVDCSTVGRVPGLLNDGMYINEEVVELPDEDKAIFESVLKDFFAEFYPSSLTFTFRCDEENSDILDLTVVGFYASPQKDFYNLGAYISEEDSEAFTPSWYMVQTTKYVLPEDAVYAYIYVPYDKTEEAFAEILDIIGVVGEDDSFIIISNSLYDSITYVSSFVEQLSTVFLWVGVGMAVFAAILLFNFISVSISNKTHEIGVLRAVGARGWDVFKIFFAESLIITAICLVLSLVGSVVLVTYLNGVVAEMMGFSYTLFVFGILSFLMMLGVAALVAFAGTFFPVFGISRKKPVESMRTV